MAQQVRFDENVQVTQTTRTGRGGPPPRGPPQKNDLAHELGNALTRGAGPGGYLAVGGEQ